MRMRLVVFVAGAQWYVFGRKAKEALASAEAEATPAQGGRSSARPLTPGVA